VGSDAVASPNEAAIRGFRETDLVAVARLIQRTIDASYSGGYPFRAVQFFKEFHSPAKIMERHRQGDLLVVEREGRLIATGAIVGADIFGVFVDPEFQRCGYGGSLMSELDTKAKARGFTASKLSVSLPSVSFYQTLGYDMLEKCSIDVGAGQSLIFWKARKPLTASEA